MEVEVIKAKTNFDNSAAVGRKDRLRVAAYCRVSTADEEQIKSYDSMVKYYTDLIKKNPDWKFVEVYADKASTGTKAETRENFQRLIADCMAGKIDMVIAKSLSRFARNTLDTLKYVRQLRTKNVAIYFEVEKINTIKDGEFLLTILSSVAQQEVENTSAYVKKGLKMKMKRGELVGFQGCLGYKYDIETKTISVDETEAETVRYMFERYVAGAGSTMIARELNEQGIMTIRGNPWTSSSVMGVINNEKYTGDILLGKTFTVDPITKRRLDNLGEEDRFFIKNHHEPIISHETFEKAQALRERRNGGRQHHVEIGKREKYSRMFAFSSLIECGFCGGHLTRRKWHSSSKYKKTIWQCVTSTKGGKKLCPDSKGIPEQVIEEAFIESYRLLCSDNQEVMNEFLSRIEKTLGDDANEKNYQKAKKEVKQYKEKRKKLLDKYVDDGIDKETYMSMDAEYEVKYAEAQSQLEYYEKQVQGDDSLRKRIEGFRKTLTQNQVLEEFDRAVFESIVEKVIVGGYDDDGNADPYKVTFIYKTGFKDSFDHAKTKFGPKSKKSDENVSSNSSVHQENQCSNHSVDTCRVRVLPDKKAFPLRGRQDAHLKHCDIYRGGCQKVSIIINGAPESTETVKNNSGIITGSNEYGVLIYDREQSIHLGIIPYDELGFPYHDVDFDAFSGKPLPYTILPGISPDYFIGSCVAFFNQKKLSQSPISLSSLEVGGKYICIVSGFCPSGAQVYLGGLNGLVKNESMSFPKSQSLFFLLSVGEEIEVSIDAIDYESGCFEACITRIASSDHYQELNDDYFDPYRFHDIEEYSDSELFSIIPREKICEHGNLGLVCCVYGREVFWANIFFNERQRFLLLQRDENNPTLNIRLDYSDRRFNARTFSNVMCIEIENLRMYYARFTILWWIVYPQAVMEFKHADLVLGSVKPLSKRNNKCLIPFYIDDTIRSNYGISMFSDYSRLLAYYTRPECTTEYQIKKVKYEIYSFEDDLKQKGSANLGCQFASQRKLYLWLKDNLNSYLDPRDSCFIPKLTTIEIIQKKLDWEIIYSYDVKREYPAEKNSLSLRLDLVKDLALGKFMYGDPRTLSLYFYQDEEHHGGVVLTFSSVYDYYSFADYFSITRDYFAEAFKQVALDIMNDAVFTKKYASRFSRVGSLLEKKVEKKLNPVVQPEDAVPDSLQKLNELIGLDSIKKDVNSLISLVKMQRVREQRGLKSIPVSLHLVFTGNPGTGKTTVARILAQIYKEIGVLKTGQLVEVDRSGLVAGYVGQTALKTQEKIKEAIGGILFIDEAYSLAKGENDFGQEAIDTILKSMEDRRGEFVVIVAGYDEPMAQFINSNPGLKSRFNKYFRFPDYSELELMQIFDMMCRKYDYHITEDTRKIVAQKIETLVQNKGENFANAREIRNYFERIITAQATRVAFLSDVSDEDVLLITAQDVKSLT